MLDLDGRFAVVTGGASGIGAAVSERLQQAGVRVASLDVQTGGPAELQLDCDVTDAASIEQAFATVHERFGGLHYGFVNAGIAGVGSFLNMPADEW
ncbi:MAG: SDR family NAD(P)-dependent oxidoreductase, partial [Acidimicrobiales bacterium]